MKFLGQSNKGSNIILLGAPYEDPFSFLKGTALAPLKIRWASESIEFFSVYQKKEAKNYTDAGDIDVYGKDKMEVYNKIKQNIYTMQDNFKFLIIGGSHSITLPVIDALCEKRKDFYVIHFDAHLDRRKKYLKDMWNYATVVKRIEDLIGEHRVFSFGCRSRSKKEKVNKNIYFFNAYEPLKDIIPLIKSKPIYITIDLDVLDPGFFPAVSNPEPNGISFKELFESLMLLKGINILGIDIVEYNPLAAPGFAPAVSVSILVRECLLLLDK